MEEEHAVPCRRMPQDHAHCFCPTCHEGLSKPFFAFRPSTTMGSMSNASMHMYLDGAKAALFPHGPGYKPLGLHLSERRPDCIRRPA